MDDLSFIRQQVRKILTEKGERRISGGKGFEEVKEQVAFAKKNPGVVMEKFGIKDYTPTGSTQAAKAAALLLRIKSLSLNSEDFTLAVESVDAVGNDIRVVVTKDEVDGESKARIPTSKLGHYLKAILVAASGAGKIKYDESASPVRHLTGEYVVITMK